MSTNTSIEWTDVTWNPVRGCSRVSPGCDHCYAMGQAHRFSGPGNTYEGLTTIRKGKVDWTGAARFVPEMLREPLRWRAPKRVFVNSMSDLFHHSVTNEQIAAVFGVMAACPRHTFQVLTKRPVRAAEWFEWAHDQRCHGNTTTEVMRSHAVEVGRFRAVDGSMPKGPGHKLLGFDTRWPLPNVWMGVSCETQNAADERIPLLLKTPAAVRFISAEPLLERIDVRPFVYRGTHRVCPRCLFSTNERIVDTDCPNGDGGTLGPDIALDGVIVGGESGPGARPCALEWIQAVVAHCRDADVPCFVKQLGANIVSEERACATDEEAASRFGFKSRWLWRARLTDRKGGDPTEWPEDLRVRRLPQESHRRS